MARSTWPWRMVLVLVLTGCGEHDRQRGPGSAAGVARGAVVARVDGATIGIDDVREVVEQAGLSPLDALRRLEDEVLLSKEATARGYARSASVAEQGRRALVQALLAQTVEQIVPEKIPAQDVRERFDLVAKRDGLAADSFAANEAAVRQQLTLEQRKTAFDKLIARLRAASKPQLDERKVQELLRDPALWGGSS